MRGGYRHDDCRASQADGAIVWRRNYATVVLGALCPYGDLARIDNCRLLNLPPYIAGDMRGTVWITGAADTWFSQPAVCYIEGYKLIGYVTKDGDGYLMFFKQQIEARGVSEKSSR